MTSKYGNLARCTLRWICQRRHPPLGNRVSLVDEPAVVSPTGRSCGTGAMTTQLSAARATAWPWSKP